MSQYKNGTVSVVQGSSVVTGSNTLWLANAAPGHGFKVQGEKAVYTINAVDADGVMQISPPYAGSDKADVSYVVWRDFTANLGLYEPSVGDIDWPFLLTQALRRLDASVGPANPFDLAMAEAWNAEEEAAYFAAGYRMVVRLDLLQGVTTPPPTTAAPTTAAPTTTQVPTTAAPTTAAPTTTKAPTTASPTTAAPTTAAPTTSAPTTTQAPTTAAPTTAAPTTTFTPATTQAPTTAAPTTAAPTTTPTPTTAAPTTAAPNTVPSATVVMTLINDPPTASVVMTLL